jgi:RNA polymerase sigma-70 factor (ECF subfamily)
MTDNLAEDDLLAECRAGSHEAYAEIYRRHQRRVYSIALNFFGGESDPANEIVQHVFIRLYGSLSQFHGDAEFTTWLYRITVNACIDEQRKRSRWFGLDEAFGFGEPRVKRNQQEKLERKEVSAEVQRVVSKLKPKLRLPILLKYVEGLSYEEISRVLEISTGTVASRLNRAHKILASKLQYLNDEGRII